MADRGEASACGATLSMLVMQPAREAAVLEAVLEMHLHDRRRKSESSLWP